jgi:putative transposase
VVGLQEQGLSQRRACELASLSRTVLTYQGKAKDDSGMIEKLKEHSQRHRRQGSRKACAGLRRQGIRVNHRKVERLWRQHGLTVPIKRRRRRRGKGLKRPLRSLYPHHVWPNEFLTPEALARALERWVQFYNHEYPHSTIGYVSPCQYERQQRQAA